jgi:UDP-N-acetylmuramate dehydrogenase
VIRIGRAAFFEPLIEIEPFIVGLPFTLMKDIHFPLKISINCLPIKLVNMNNFCLSNYHTFNIKTTASNLVVINKFEQFENLINTEKLKILGEGSNVLFTKEYSGTIVINKLKGIKFEEEKDCVYVTACSGENFDEVISKCLDLDLYGIENLSGIPGTMGAAPIQNIGAYGVELKDIFHKLSAFNLKTNKIEEFFSHDCQFSYRNSIFKNECADKYYILDVTLKLSKIPILNFNYPDLLKFKNQISQVKDLRNLILSIRKEKLPNYNEIGNAGSFFKNPVISKNQFSELQKIFPTIPGYIQENDVKIPAAWLIEKCGWKGKNFKTHGVYSKHSLILVNFKDAKGSDILNLATQIQLDVKKSFNIQIESEVNIY